MKIKKSNTQMFVSNNNIDRLCQYNKE